MCIRVIITGGTIDKSYEPVPGDLACRETHMRDILARVRCTVPVEIEVNQMIDSLHMTDADRERVAHAVEACGERRVVVTHGTDTMVETASLVGRTGVNFDYYVFTTANGTTVPVLTIETVGN